MVGEAEAWVALLSLGKKISQRPYLYVGRGPCGWVYRSYRAVSIK